MCAVNNFISRGFVPPQVHGTLDYPLAAVLIAGPLVLVFHSTAATVIALAFGGGAAVLAVVTAWPTGIVKMIPPRVHGYADALVAIALIVLPLAVGFSSHPPVLLFYVIVGALGLLVTLATRFESPQPTAHAEVATGPLGVVGFNHPNGDPTRGRTVRARPDADPTQGRRSGTHRVGDPTRGRANRQGRSDDPTRGREIGCDPFADPTQGRAIGSGRWDDPTAVRARRAAERTTERSRAVRTRMVAILILPKGPITIRRVEISMDAAAASLQTWPAVTDPVIAYTEWRMSCTAVWVAYREWSTAAIADTQLAHAAYMAALDREDAAAHAYSGLMTTDATRRDSPRSG